MAPVLRRRIAAVNVELVAMVEVVRVLPAAMAVAVDALLRQLTRYRLTHDAVGAGRAARDITTFGIILFGLCLLRFCASSMTMVFFYNEWLASDRWIVY